MNTDEVNMLHSGSRLTHVATGTPAIVEQISWWGSGAAIEDQGRVRAVLRFGGNPRTDPWGPFVESPRYSDEEARDPERITIERGQLGEWERA